MIERELYFVEREFAAPIDVVWQAWTRAEELEEWYHPTALDVVPGSVTSEPVVGGRWAVAVDVPMHGFVAYFWGRYLDVVEPSRIEHTLCYSQEEAEFIARDDEAPSHRIVIEFTDNELSTVVRFTQIGDMPGEQADASRLGMESYFDSLEAFLR